MLQYYHTRNVEYKYSSSHKVIYLETTVKGESALAKPETTTQSKPQRNVIRF
jgi:hypothetical protein